MTRIIFDDDSKPPIELGPDYTFEILSHGRLIRVYKRAEGSQCGRDMNAPYYVFNTNHIYLIEVGLPDKELNLKYEINRAIQLKL